MIKKLIFSVHFLLLIGLQINAQDSEAIAVTIGDRVVTVKEIDKMIAEQIKPLQEQIDVLRKVAIKNYITKVLLEHEAKRRQLTVEDLRKDTLT